MSQAHDRHQDLLNLVNDLRATLQEIGEDSLPQTQVVSNTRDRLRYIASLTEQAASQTLNAAEQLGERLKRQQTEAEELAGLTRSPRLRAFLAGLREEHAASGDDLREIVQAQAFQDLVGQVVNKLLVTVERMETGLAHLLIEDEAENEELSGPQVRREEQISQDDVDSLFG
ncbi:MAG: protein phosphatase CheZ [Pseudomonadota bacterium]